VDRRSGCTGERHHSMGSEKTLARQVTNDVENNHRATVVKEIAHIHFPSLAYLHLLGTASSPSRD
jgi:hypothetical protein